MLAPRASSAFVCIRCELKLARPRLPLLLARPPQAAFSSASRRRDADDTAQIQLPQQPQRVSAHPLGRIRKRRGRADLREITARLEDIKTLGEDAEILVLKEAGVEPSEEKQTPEIVHSLAHEAPNIIESLRHESRPLTPQDIINQLDSLRPKSPDPYGPHYVSQSTFVKLSRTVLQGFTGRQLSHYYSVTKGVKDSQVGNEVLDGLKQLQSRTSRPAERSEWHPGTTQIDQRLPGLAVHRKPKRGAISKHLLVDQILRDVWKLVLLEEIEAPGELELSLKPWQLSILSSGSAPTPLEKIRSQRKAKLEIHWPHNVLRITADKTTAEYAADDVERILKNLETRPFPLAPWDPYLEEDFASKDSRFSFPEKSLQAVTELTGAAFQLGPRRVLMIRALNESAAEEANRCLIRLLPLKKSSSYTIDPTRRDAVKDQTYLCPGVYEKTSLAFDIRDVSLGRWVLPTQRSQPVKPESQETATFLERDDAQEASTGHGLENVQSQVLELLRESKHLLPEKRPGTVLDQETWATEPEPLLSAEYGHALFSLDDPPPPAAAKTAVFVSTVPGLTKLLWEHGSKQSYHLGAPALEYSFVAAPEQQDFLTGQQFPRLYVQFRYDKRSGDHAVHRISLGLDSRIHDVLFPDQAVDVRFYFATVLHLKDFKTDSKVQEFIQAVMANIQSGEKLAAPNFDLDIPKWTISGSDYCDITETQTVKYLFTGIRFRQSVSMSNADTPFTYSTTQSGKLGRKGPALKTYFNNRKVRGKKITKSSFERESQVRGFVKTCYKMVEKITRAAGNGVVVAKAAKARNLVGARKPRRQAEQAAATHEDFSTIADERDSASNMRARDAYETWHRDHQSAEETVLGSPERDDADPPARDSTDVHGETSRGVNVFGEPHPFLSESHEDNPFHEPQDQPSATRSNRDGGAAKQDSEPLSMRTAG